MLIAGLESGTSKVPHGESTGLRSRQKATLEQKQEGFTLPLGTITSWRGWQLSEEPATPIAAAPHYWVSLKIKGKKHLFTKVDVVSMQSKYTLTNHFLIGKKVANRKSKMTSWHACKSSEDTN